MMERFLEMREHLKSLTYSKKGQVSLYIFDTDAMFTLSFRPYGYQAPGIVNGSVDIFGKGATLEDAFNDTCTKWHAISDEIDGRRVIAMAEFIAAHLVKNDEITAAHLRQQGFADEEIERVGPRACELAAEAANKHPVVIITIENSNGAPAALTDDVSF